VAAVGEAVNWTGKPVSVQSSQAGETRNDTKFSSNHPRPVKQETTPNAIKLRIILLLPRDLRQVITLAT
jgi:hypothetical protein